MAKIQQRVVFRDHELAHRYLDGFKGIEIGASENNPHNIAGTINVDYSDEHTRFKEVEVEICGTACKVDVVAEADELPFDDSSQDFVLSSHVFEHLPDPIKAVKEWIRVVRPGGIIFAVVALSEGPGTHPADNGKPITELDHYAEDHERGETVETHPIPEGHEKRGHYHRFSYQSMKAFVKRFFPTELKYIDGEPTDSKVGVGHTHVLRVTKPTPTGSPRIDIKPQRVRVWINMPDETGCTYYRAAAPFQFCHEELSQKGIDLYRGGVDGGAMPDSSYDVYVQQRAPDPSAYTFFHWVLKSNRRLIWELDDDFNSIPKWSPAYEGVRKGGNFAALGCYLDFAHAITTSTPFLAAKIEADFTFTKGKTVVLPNLVDVSKYRRVLPSPGRTKRIIWTGSGFHAADLELLVPVVQKIVDETDWEFVFMGAIPPDIFKFPERRVWSLGGAQIKYYPRLLCELSADVAVIPLTRTLFDRSKSAIKWMECSLAGAAVVATKFGPYEDAIEDGQTGIFIENPNDPDEWMGGIRYALEHRERLVANAIPEVMNGHSWHSMVNRQRWVDFFVEQARLSIEFQNAHPLP